MIDNDCGSSCGCGASSEDKSVEGQDRDKRSCSACMFLWAGALVVVCASVANLLF